MSTLPGEDAWRDTGLDGHEPGEVVDLLRAGDTPEAEGRTTVRASREPTSRARRPRLTSPTRRSSSTWATASPTVARRARSGPDRHGRGAGTQVPAPRPCPPRTEGPQSPVTRPRKRADPGLRTAILHA